MCCVGGASRAALELEHARVAANKPFTRMTLEPLKVIVKCVFKLKGMAGASNRTKKDDLGTFLEHQDEFFAWLVNYRAGWATDAAAR